VDRGPIGEGPDESFFDARMLAELSPDQLLDTVAGQQAALVPVRDVAVDSRIDPQGVQRSATITYAVAATGEFGEIRLEQIAADTLTAASFLGGERISFGITTPDEMTMSRSLRAAERLADLDPGILSAPSVFANQTALDGLLQFGPTLAESSCEEGCNRQAALASIFVDLVGGSRSGSTKLDAARVAAGFLTAAPEAYAHQRIEARRNLCLAVCMLVRPLPPPGTLSGVYIFDYFPVEFFDQSVTFSGQLIQALGGTGRTNFTITRTESFEAGSARSIGFSVEGLTEGIWQVTADHVVSLNPRVTVRYTCDNVRVSGFIRINNTDGLGGRCEQTPP
jgi:hypothetical protein